MKSPAFCKEPGGFLFDMQSDAEIRIMDMAKKNGKDRVYCES